MTTSTRRLDRVEAALSPQTVLLWMGEAHQYPTISAYMDALKDASDTKYPMTQLPRQVAQAARSARKGQKLEAITWAERRAVREVAFLFYLQLQVNTRLWGEWRAMCLHLAHVASQLRGLFQEDAPRFEDLAEAREHAEHAIREFPEWDVAITKIADHPPRPSTLPPSTRRCGRRTIPHVGIVGCASYDAMGDRTG